MLLINQVFHSWNFLRIGDELHGKFSYFWNQSAWCYWILYQCSRAVENCWQEICNRMENCWNAQPYVLRSKNLWISIKNGVCSYTVRVSSQQAWDRESYPGTISHRAAYGRHYSGKNWTVAWQTFKVSNLLHSGKKWIHTSPLGSCHVKFLPWQLCCHQWTSQRYKMWRNDALLRAIASNWLCGSTSCLSGNLIHLLLIIISIYFH